MPRSVRALTSGRGCLVAGANTPNLLADSTSCYRRDYHHRQPIASRRPRVVQSEFTTQTRARHLVCVCGAALFQQPPSLQLGRGERTRGGGGSIIGACICCLLGCQPRRRPDGAHEQTGSRTPAASRDHTRARAHPKPVTLAIIEAARFGGGSSTNKPCCECAAAEAHPTHTGGVLQPGFRTATRHTLQRHHRPPPQYWQCTQVPGIACDAV
jgi:hypothetical protein